MKTPLFNRGYYATPDGVHLYFGYNPPGFRRCRGSTPGLYYVAPLGLNIPQPLGLPFFITTAESAVISLSATRIISLCRRHNFTLRSNISLSRQAENQSLVGAI